MAGTSGEGSGGAEPSGGASGTAGTGSDACPSDRASVSATSKRLVRLSFNQLAASIRTLFGAALADQIATELEIPDPDHRGFPPLAAVDEGWTVIDSVWTRLDRIGDIAREYALDNFDALTGCGSDPSAECAEQALLTLAEQAFRRPLEDADESRLLQVFGEVLDTDATVEEAFSYGVYAIMSSPNFVYRTEFGSDPESEGQLTDYEMASQLSYFLTDGPPDEELLEVASEGELTSDATLETQARRLLDDSVARENLTAAMFGHFGLAALDSVVFDPDRVVDFNEGLRRSMSREAELFFGSTLWSGSLADLVTSRRSFVNEALASLYGVDYPVEDADADGFAPVTLPAERAGIVTNAGFLTTGSRVDGAHVVPRGLRVLTTLSCDTVDPSPEIPEAMIDDEVDLSDATEREKMEYRLAEPACSECHWVFDPYGMLLYSFDAIGQYRTADLEGRPIDAAVALQDGTPLGDAQELADHLVESGELSRCMARSFLRYALQEYFVDIQSCAVTDVVETFDAREQTFEDLMLDLVLSPAFSTRSRGDAQ